MGRKRISVTMGITLPPELRRQMDDFGKDVNWSQVAAEAFHLKVLQIKATGEKMNGLIEQFKAAAEIESNENFGEGLLAGRKWATSGTTGRPPIKGLKRLEREVEASDGNGNGDAAYFVGVCENGSNEGVAIGLYKALHGEQEYTNRREESHAVATFWDDVIGDGGNEMIGDEHFARGFIEGALEVWQSVKDKI